MPPEFAELIGTPLGVIVILSAGVLIGIGLEKLARWQNRRRWQQRYGRRDKAPSLGIVPPRVPDAADQLRTVMEADFKPQRLLNKSEARLFRAIDKQVLAARPDWQVMAQVSLGEILLCEDK